MPVHRFPAEATSEEKKKRNAAQIGSSAQTRADQFWSAKVPNPLRLLLRWSPGRSLPPTVRPWQDCWCPSPCQTPMPSELYPPPRKEEAG